MVNVFQITSGENEPQLEKKVTSKNYGFTLGAQTWERRHGSAGVTAGRVIINRGRNPHPSNEARQRRAFIIYTTGGDAGAPMAKPQFFDITQ